MAKLKNLLGQKFGMLTVVAFSHKHRQPCGAIVNYWSVKCDCGAVFARKSTHLMTKPKVGPQSCGCDVARQVSKRFRSHGMKAHRLYSTWQSMMRRCYDPKDKFYYCYGARDIKVCQRWHDVKNFCEDMELILTKGLSLERIKNDGEYSPSNCTGATTKQQARNKRTNRRITHNGQTKCLADWASELNLPVVTLHHRLKSGWPIDRVMTSNDHRFSNR